MVTRATTRKSKRRQGATAKGVSAAERLRASVRTQRHPSPVSFGSVDTPLGRVFVAVSNRGVVATSLPGEPGDRFRERAGVGHAPSPPTRLLTEALRQVREYAAGARRAFDLPLDLRATPFTEKVLRALERVPHGTVTTYGAFARAIGAPRAARAVGLALSRNPVPLILACHRVVASDGTLGGFAGKARALDVKRRLLAHEAARRTAPRPRGRR